MSDEEYAEATRKVQEEIASRRQHFGITGDPIPVVVNGIRFFIDAPSQDPTSWKIVGAEMVDVKEFLKQLPQELQNRVSDGIMDEIINQ